MKKEACISVNPEMFIVTSGSEIVCEIDGEIYKVRLCEDMSVSNLREKTSFVAEIVEKLANQSS